MKILANSTFVDAHLAIVDHRWYIFPSLKLGKMTRVFDEDSFLSKEQKEVRELLDSGNSTIGGQRCLAARIRTWNLPESSF